MSGGMAYIHLFTERVAALGLRKQVCGEGVHWQERGMKRESTYAEALGVPHLGGRSFLELKRGTAPPVGMVKGRELVLSMGSPWPRLRGGAFCFVPHTVHTCCRPLHVPTGQLARPYLRGSGDDAGAGGLEQ